jgi:DNA-binding response OmpR family regulator
MTQVDSCKILNQMKRIKSNILIIESNYAMRLFLHNYLSREYNVQSFSSFEEAFENHEMHFFPEVIISNYCIEDEKNGLEILQNSLLLREKPLIMLTDEDKSAQRIEALKAGVSDCISKPFNPVELSVRINRLVEANVSETYQNRLEVV